MPPLQTSFKDNDEKGKYITAVLDAASKAVSVADKCFNQLLYP
jgi:hypothetical protein